MSKLFDRLKNAARLRGENAGTPKAGGLLSQALQRAQTKRDQARDADDPVAAQLDTAAAESVAAGNEAAWRERDERVLERTARAREELERRAEAAALARAEAEQRLVEAARARARAEDEAAAAALARADAEERAAATERAHAEAEEDAHAQSRLRQLIRPRVEHEMRRSIDRPHRKPELPRHYFCSVGSFCCPGLYP